MTLSLVVLLMIFMVISCIAVIYNMRLEAKNKQLQFWKNAYEELAPNEKRLIEGLLETGRERELWRERTYGNSKGLKNIKLKLKRTKRQLEDTTKELNKKRVSLAIERLKGWALKNDLKKKASKKKTKSTKKKVPKNVKPKKAPKS